MSAETGTEYAMVSWFEVARIRDGGFMAFELNDYGNRRKPVLACTHIHELTAYLTRTMAPEVQKALDRDEIERLMQTVSRGGSGQNLADATLKEDRP